MTETKQYDPTVTTTKKRIPYRSITELGKELSRVLARLGFGGMQSQMGSVVTPNTEEAGVTLLGDSSPLYNHTKSVEAWLGGYEAGYERGREEAKKTAAQELRQEEYERKRSTPDVTVLGTGNLFKVFVNGKELYHHDLPALTLKGALGVVFTEYQLATVTVVTVGKQKE